MGNANAKSINEMMNAKDSAAYVGLGVIIDNDSMMYQNISKNMYDAISATDLYDCNIYLCTEDVMLGINLRHYDRGLVIWADEPVSISKVAYANKTAMIENVKAKLRKYFTPERFEELSKDFDFEANSGWILVQIPERDKEMTVRCIKEYAENGEVFWSKGCVYDAIKRTDGNWSIKTDHNSVGCVGPDYMLEDFYDYFEEMGV